MTSFDLCSNRRSTAWLLLECAAYWLAATLATGCHARASQPQPDSTTAAAAASVPASPSAAATSLEDAYWERTKQVFNVPVEQSPVLGPPGALITIVEFSEFDCESCRAMASVLKALRVKYGDQVRLVWKNKPLPRQPSAEPAAEAALELRAEKGDGAFWEMHDRLFEQRSAFAGSLRENRAQFLKLAAGFGADPGKLRRSLADHTHRAEIERDLDLAEDFEVEGTPHFFVNGRRLEGVQPQAKFERMIEEELPKARLAAASVAPTQLYESLVAGGPGPWRPEQKTLLAWPKSDPTLGSEGAPVTVHVWSDYQCAVCNAVERMISALQTQHGAQIRFVWHDLPLARHDDARALALAQREAYQQRGANGFWAMHRKIYFDPQVPTPAELDGFARDLGLDFPQWKAALASGAHAAELDADIQAAGEEGISETPAFLVAARGAGQATFVGHVEYASKLSRAIQEKLAASGSSSHVVRDED